MSSVLRRMRERNRFELKYLITREQAERLKVALAATMVPDTNGKRDGHYTVASLYYDSPDLRCYREKEAGIKFRRKLRIRLYGTGDVVTEETPVFVEIKQRIDRVTQKRRAMLPYAEALRLCQDRQMPDLAPENEAVIEEIYEFLWRYNLRPASIVRYERHALAGADYDIGLRVTFDTFLSCQCWPLHLHEPPSGLPMLPPNLVVLEIKVNERVPYWLVDLIAAHNLQSVPYSKYSRGIELGETLSSRAYRHLPAERSEDVLSTAPSVLEIPRPFSQPSLNDGNRRARRHASTREGLMG